MTDKKIFVSLPAILLAGILLRLLFFTGIYDHDDYKYAQHAYDFLRLKETLRQDMALYREHVENRHKFFIPSTKYYAPLYVPVAFLYKLFGVSAGTTFLWPFICSIGNIALVFFLAELIFHNKGAGLLAAGLASFFPFGTIFATRLMPDEISNFFAGLTVLFFLKSSGRKSWSYMAGLMLGITYLLRCYFLILLLPFFIYALWKKKVSRMFLPVISGFLIVFAMENIFFLCLHFMKGAPLIFRLKVEQDLTVYLMKPMGLQSNLALLKQFPRPLFDFNFMGLYYYILIPVFLYLIFAKKIKEAIIPLVWFFYCLLGLWFLPVRLRPLTFINRDPRYLNILTMPMILMLAFFISGIIRRYPRPGGGLVILLLASSFLSLTNQIYGPDTDRFGAESFKITAGILRIIPARTLYCDNPTASTKINYYFKFNPPFQIKRSDKLTPEDRDVYVLIHDLRKTPPMDKAGIINSIKAGEVLGGRTEHLIGEEFDLSRWALLNTIKGRGGYYIYFFYIPA